MYASSHMIHMKLVLCKLCNLCTLYDKWLSLEGLVKESSRCWSVQTGIPQFVVLVGAAGLQMILDNLEALPFFAKMLTFRARFLRCLWKWRGSESPWKRSRMLPAMRAVSEWYLGHRKEDNGEVCLKRHAAWVFEDSPMFWVSRKKINMLKSRSLRCSSSQLVLWQKEERHTARRDVAGILPFTVNPYLWPFLSFDSRSLWTEVKLQAAAEHCERVMADREGLCRSWAQALCIVKQWES